MGVSLTRLFIKSDRTASAFRTRRLIISGTAFFVQIAKDLFPQLGHVRLGVDFCLHPGGDLHGDLPAHLGARTDPESGLASDPIIQQTCRGSFSAVLRQIFASKKSVCSILQDLLTFAPLQSQMLQRLTLYYIISQESVNLQKQNA